VALSQPPQELPQMDESEEEAEAQTSCEQGT
jgi:hypothetical protein